MCPKHWFRCQVLFRRHTWCRVTTTLHIDLGTSYPLSPSRVSIWYPFQIRVLCRSRHVSPLLVLWAHIIHTFSTILFLIIQNSSSVYQSFMANILKKIYIGFRNRPFSVHDMAVYIPSPARNDSALFYQFIPLLIYSWKLLHDLTDPNLWGCHSFLRNHNSHQSPISFEFAGNGNSQILTEFCQTALTKFKDWEPWSYIKSGELRLINKPNKSISMPTKSI